MPITVSCQCGAKFAAKDELAGKAVKCPKCSQPLRIPSADTPAAPAAKPTPAAPKKAPAPTPAPSDPGIGSILDEFGIQGSATGIRCPSCQADMQPGAILCVACGYNTQTNKKLSTKADSDAKKRREEIDRKQREAAEKAGKTVKAARGGRSGEYVDEASADLVFIREGGSLGSVWPSTMQIIFSPVNTFGGLQPGTSVGLAIQFPSMAGFGLVLVYGLIFLGFLVFLAILALAGGAPITDVLIVLGMGALNVAIIAAVVAVVLLATVPVLGLLIAVLSHPLVKYAGGSALGFGDTYRCTMYTLGASLVVSAIPCVNIAAPVALLLSYIFALQAHHKVSAGVAAGAAILGLAVGSVLMTIAWITVYTPAFIWLAHIIAENLKRS